MKQEKEQDVEGVEFKQKNYKIIIQLIILIFQQDENHRVTARRREETTKMGANTITKTLIIKTPICWGELKLRWR